MRPIKRAMFDNDGVNIDSEDQAMRVMDTWGSELIKRYKPDANLSEDYIYRKYPGTSTDAIVRKLIEEFDLPENSIRNDYTIPDETDTGTFLADLITHETNNHFRNHLTCIPGAPQALMAIRNTLGGENVCLATTSREDRMDVSLACAVDPDTGKNAGLDAFFPKGDLRRSGYGYPNKYEEAFGATGWDPAETVVIEDSRSGVTKAKAASNDVRVIGTVAARFYEDKPAQARALLEDGASLVISNFADLPKALQWLNGGMNPKEKPSFDSAVYTPESFDRVKPDYQPDAAPAPSVL